MGDKASQWEALLSAALKDFLDQSKHPILIEVAVAQICISPVAQLELAALFSRNHINAGRRQPLQVFLTQHGIDNMEDLLAALEAFLNERQQHPIFFLRAVKECADMALSAKHGAGEANRLAALARSFSRKLSIITSWIPRILLSIERPHAIIYGLVIQ